MSSTSSTSLLDKSSVVSGITTRLNDDVPILPATVEEAARALDVVNPGLAAKLRASLATSDGSGRAVPSGADVPPETKIGENRKSEKNRKTEKSSRSSRSKIPAAPVKGQRSSDRDVRSHGRRRGQTAARQQSVRVKVAGMLETPLVASRRSRDGAVTGGAEIGRVVKPRRQASEAAGDDPSSDSSFDTDHSYDTDTDDTSDQVEVLNVGRLELRVEFGTVRYKLPIDLSKLKMTELSFNGNGAHPIVSLMSVLEHWTREVFTRELEPKSAWTLLYANLSGVPRNVTANCHSWTEGVGVLLNIYAGAQAQTRYVEYLRAELRQKPAERVFEFALRAFKNMGMFPDSFPEEDRADLFRRRLDVVWIAANPFAVAKLSAITSVEEMTQYLSTLEEVLPVSTGRDRDRTNRSDDYPSDRRGNSGAGKGGGGSRRRKQQTRENKREKRDLSHITCHQCGEKGHYKDQCPSTKAADKSPVSKGDAKGDAKKSVTFDSGAKKGYSGGKKKSNFRKVNYIGSAGSKKVIACLLRPDGSELRAELDSGSDFNLITSELAKKMGADVVPLSSDHRDVRVCYADGRPLELSGEATISFLFGSGPVSLVWLICDAVSTPLLAYMQLPGLNNLSHEDGVAKQLTLCGEEFRLDNGADRIFRRRMLSSQQLQGGGADQNLDDRLVNKHTALPSTIGSVIADEPVFLPDNDWADVDKPCDDGDEYPPLVGSESDGEDDVGTTERITPVQIGANNENDSDGEEIEEDCLPSVDERFQNRYINSVSDAPLPPECNFDKTTWAAMSDAQRTRFSKGLADLAEHSRQVSDTLPPDRGPFNFRIELKDGQDRYFDGRRRYSQAQSEAAYEMFAQLSRHGRIREINPREAKGIVNLTFPYKKDGVTMRPCADYSRFNKKLVLESTAQPSVAEIKDDMDATCTIFATIDLDSAFHSILVDKECLPYTCVYGPKGEVWQYLVMAFGWATAPQTFRYFISNALAGLPGVVNYVDDLFVEAHSVDELLDRMEGVYSRLREHFCGANIRKMHVGPRIPCLGEIRTPAGFIPDPERVSAIMNLDRPRDITGVRSLLGALRQIAHHVPDLSRILGPLNKKTSKSTPFSWDEKDDALLDRIKAMLAEAITTAVPDWSLPFVIECDASESGVGGVLLQERANGEKVYLRFFGQPFKENSWSTFSREAYAVIFAVDQCADYLVGRKFKIRTDHKPLLWIYNTASKSKGRQSRVFRWSVILDAFVFDIEHISGPQNYVADALSRPPFLPVPATRSGGGDEFGEPTSHYINAVRKAKPSEPPTIDPTPYAHLYDAQFGADAFSIAALISLTLEKPTIQSVKERVPELVDLVFDDLLESVITHLPQLSATNGVLRHETGFYIPVDRRDKVLQVGHADPAAGHFGVSKTMAALQGRAWWPDMKSWVEHFIDTCGHCQRFKPQRPIGAPLQAWEPARIWERVHIDLIEFVLTTRGNRYLLTVVDSMSKMLFAFPLTRKTADVVVGHLTSLFASVGRPLQLVCDNGKEFNNSVMRTVADRLGITLHFVTPLHHAANGQGERMNQTLETVMRTIVEPDQSNWDSDSVYGVAVRAMNNARPSNGASPPTVVWHGRPVYGPLDTVVGPLPPISSESVAQRWADIDTTRRLTSALEGRARLAAVSGEASESPKSLKVGDLVWVKFSATKPGKTKKLSAAQQGPYRVLSVDSDSRAELQHYLRPADRLRRHFNELVLFRGDLSNVAVENEWTVERVVNERRNSGKLQYLVHWSGFPDSSDSWVDATSVNAPDVLARWASIKSKGKVDILPEQSEVVSEPTMTGILPTVVRVVDRRTSDNGVTEYLVALSEEEGPDDYSWVRPEQVANSHMLETFQPEVLTPKKSISPVSTKSDINDGFTLVTKKRGRGRPRKSPVPIAEVKVDTKPVRNPTVEKRVSARSTKGKRRN